MSTRMLYIREKLKRCAEFVNEYNDSIVFEDDKLSFYKMAISGDVIPLPIGITMSDMALYFEVCSSKELRLHFFPNAERIAINFVTMEFRALEFHDDYVCDIGETILSIVELAKLYTCNIDFESVVSCLKLRGFILSDS